MTAIEPLTSAPLVQIARALRRGQVSPVELLDAYTRRIQEAAGLRAYITPPDERAQQEARRAERRLSRQSALPAALRLRPVKAAARPVGPPAEPARPGA